MEPLFGAFGSVLMGPDFGLQPRDLFFGRTKLVGKLLSQVERLLTICFGHSGRLVKQPHDGLPSVVKLGCFIRTGVLRRMTKRDYGLRLVCVCLIATRLITHDPLLDRYSRPKSINLNL